ncbi:terminase ATPase subunit family protein [Methylobacillus glycogenes]|uniref:terminase ATPase subunit family protein n=1 Tax=Methylobacillus glycogenes TaxID=406 RepID=UPI00046EC48A|nr:terminase ATPase subunit family protein [Methylobacillus glycogenes]
MNQVADIDPRKQAKLMYWQGYRVARIAETLGEKPATIHSWKRRDNWDATTPLDRVELSIESRLIELTLKDNKEGKDFKEIDLLGRQLERTSRVRKHDKTGKEVDLNPNVEARTKGKRKQSEKNAITEEQEAQLIKGFKDNLFDYQRTWYRAGSKERIRNILKSRQIGATWYFAREAFCDALVTGRNQIFLSASKAQAHVFKQYIIQFAMEFADVELKGDPIVLPNGATLYFLGTNSKTAQSYHGNLYVDEYFWINNFKELRKTASGMAAHKHWRQTYFSTPSSLNHQAYPFWDGSLFNHGRSGADKVEFEVTHEALAKGMRCPDGQWRQIVTIHDALKAGCNLFDLDQLMLEYSPEDFLNLFGGKFIDDSESVFDMTALQKCMVDSWVVWEDYKPFTLRPLAYQEVWIGYDPALSGDSAGIVVLAPPSIPGGKFRILERHQWKGMDFEAQSKAIKKITEAYNVTYIGIDTTGIGYGVYELVTKFHPNVKAFRYDPEVKGALVMKAQNVINNGRLEFDAGMNDLAQAFLAIKKTITPGGRSVTYTAGRSKAVSHADIAWATMHALANEPLDGAAINAGSFMEISQ